MKRAQIEEARRAAERLREEERRMEEERKGPMANDFSVSAHLFRKHAQMMSAPLNETASHARNAVFIQHVTLVPKLKLGALLDELKHATHFTKALSLEVERNGGNAFISFKQWKYFTKPSNASQFVKIMFMLIASKAKLVRSMQHRKEILIQLAHFHLRIEECNDVIKKEGYHFFKQEVQRSLEAGKVHLKIKTSAGKKHILDFENDDRVLRVKETLKRLDNVEIENQHLIFEGKLLVDEARLDICHVQNKSSLDVVYREYPMVKRMSSHLKDQADAVLETCKYEVDPDADIDELVEEVAYLRDFIHEYNSFVHHVNISHYVSKHRKKLMNERAQKKKRITHNKKGRKSSFIHGYPIVVDPGVLVRIAQVELNRAQMAWEEVYRSLQIEESKIRQEFVVICQRTYRFKKWLRASNDRAERQKSKEARIKASMEAYTQRKVDVLRKQHQRKKMLEDMRLRKAALIMQRHLRNFMKRKYPPNGIRPKWDQDSVEKFDPFARDRPAPVHKCHICKNGKAVFKNYDDLRNHLNEHKARDRQRKWRMEAEKAMLEYEREQWEKRENIRKHRKIINAKEEGFLNELRETREAKRREQEEEQARRVRLGMDLPYEPEVAVLYLYRQPHLNERMYDGIPGEIRLNKRVTSVGRGDDAKVKIKSNFASRLLSRVHCTFYVETHPYSGKVAVSVVDNNSTNGTFVNGFEVYPTHIGIARLPRSRESGTRSASLKLRLQGNETNVSTPPVIRTSRSNVSSLGTRSRVGTPFSTGTLQSREYTEQCEFEYDDGVFVENGDLVTLGCAPGRPNGHSFLVYQLEIRGKDPLL